jgi:hypothetical protein
MTSSFPDILRIPTWLLPEGAHRAAPLYHPDAVLEVHLPGLDNAFRGPADIVGYLSARWPAGVRAETLSLRESPGGVQLRIQVTTDEGSAARERHLLHVRDQQIGLHVIYPERVPFVVGDEALTADSGPIGRALKGAVMKTPLPPGFSGAPLEKIVLSDGGALIVKHIARRWSWVMRATDDDGREAAMWAQGRQPAPGIETAIVDSVRLPDRWLLYMEDVSDLVSAVGALSPTEEVTLLRRIATASTGSPPDTHLCSLKDRLSLFSPATAARERDGTDLGPKIIGRGWQLIRDLIPTDLFLLAHGLASDPEPLARALAASPSRFLHGDLRPGNLGVDGARLVLIDWGLASWGPPALDLTWYLFNRRWPTGLEEGLAVMRDALGDPADETAIDLSVVATFIQACPYFGFNVVQEPDPAARKRAADDLDSWITAAGLSLDRSAHLLSL